MMTDESILRMTKKTDDQGSKIISYQGIEGLKQVTLNSLKAKDGIYIYEISSMNQFVDPGFAEDVRRQFVKNQIHIKQLTNLVFLDKWTKIEELVEKYWEARYIDPKKFEIKAEILIYNDVVAIYDFKKEIFCAEIYNQNLARMQKQLFEFIWNLAEKPIIGKGGRTSLF